MHSRIIASIFCTLTLVFGLWPFVLSIDNAEAAETTVPTDFKASDQYFNKDLYEEVPDESFMLSENSLPSPRSQDGGETCIDFCKATLIQYRYCKEQNKQENCKSLNENGMDLVSPIHIRSLSSPNPNPNDRTLPQHSIAPLNSSHPTIWDFDHFNALRKKSFLSDSCFPYDQFVSHEDINSNSEALKKFYFELEQRFIAIKEEYKDKKVTEADFVGNCQKCDEIREQIVKTFPVKPDHLTIASALNQKSFEEFLQIAKLGLRDPSKADATKNHCKSIKLKEAAYLNPFPGPIDNATTTKRQAVAEAKKQLKLRKEPIRMDNICMDRWVSDNSCGAHCMLITGYKTVRSKTNPNEKKVLIRMLNSWGEGWQKDHNDGWIDEDKLMSNLNDNDIEYTATKQNNKVDERKKRTTATKKPDEKGIPSAILSWLL